MGNLENKKAMKGAMTLLKDKIKFCFQTILTELDYTDTLSLFCWAYIHKHGTKNDIKFYIETSS